MSVSAFSPAEPVLQPGLPSGRSLLVSLACGAGLPPERGRAPAASGAGSPVSGTSRRGCNGLCGRREAAWRGPSQAADRKNFLLRAAGCYVLFVPCCGYVPQKFCSGLCRQALRAVRVREARWRARLLGAAGVQGSAWVCGP